MTRGEQAADVGPSEALEAVDSDGPAVLDGTMQLASGIVHDLRNSIGYIASNVSPLGQYVEDILELIEVYSVLEEGLSEEERDYVGRFKSAIDFDRIADDLNGILSSMNLGSTRSASLIDEMRVLFIPGARIVRLPANPVEATEQSIQIFRDRFGAEVDFVISNNVTVDEVACPKTAFIRVLDNLLINAVHACRAGADSRVSVSLESNPLTGDVTVAVSDNGVGIPDEVKPRLFEPYFSTREAAEGTGLGLAIVRKIIRDYEGELDFESVEGQGTTFRFTVPIRK